MNALALLRQQGFSTLACQFASYISRQQTPEDPLLTLSAGLLSEAVSDGHVCLNLASEQVWPAEILQHLPDAKNWQQQLTDNAIVGQPGDFKPLILTSDGRLYLQRYWQDEQQVATAIRQRATALKQPFDNVLLQRFFANWQQSITDIDWQKIAVLSALSQQLTVISGGPGTGKTTVVLKILQALQQLQADARIALAAPTGKAAARLQSAVSDAQTSTDAKTLHRLLGISQRLPEGRFNADNPLPLDLLIIDEASMIDISLMALTLKALPVNARLILLGDADQLASVESGAVLASLSDKPPAFSSQFAALAKQVAGITLTESTDSNPLQDCLIKLQHSYRFASGSVIGQLAEAVRLGDTEALAKQLKANPEILQPNDKTTIEKSLLAGYQNFIHAVEKRLPATDILNSFEQFRMLCALRQGPFSVASVNLQMQQLLARRGWRTAQPFYPGRPVMVTQNQYRLNLFNGDVGVILPNADGELQACFLFAGELRWIPLSRLPAHETVFAMTVHKSQGSEFDTVSILLPEDISPVLNRQLLYTSITRARKTLSILSTDNVLRHTISTNHQRESGLSFEAIG